MDESVRKLVRERADDRCEYCRLPQGPCPGIRFHVEHVRPKQHGGNDDPVNLAFACPNCNWAKGPNMSAIDPETDSLTPLYDPRSDIWSVHFALADAEIIGLTIVGRATVRLLRMNDAGPLEVRRALCVRGEF